MSAIKNISVPPSAIRVLRNKLARTRFSILAVELARRLTVTFSFLITLLTSLLFLDLLADLKIETRSLLLFSIITLTAILIIWSLFSLITKWKNDETLALEIERKNKDFDSRLISSIQFAKRKAKFPENAPMSMVHNMILETKDVSKKYNFLKIVNPKALTRATLIFFVIIITSGIWVYSEKDNIPILVKRALGEQIEIPRDTTIIEEPNISKVGIGDNIQMTFRVKSKKNSELKANLNIEYNSGRNVKVSLERTEKEPDTYTGTIEDVPESFSFNAQIDAAKVALEGVEREAAVGSRTVLDVLDSEQELLDAKVSLIGAQKDEVLASFQLLEATGQLTAKKLGLAVKVYDPTNYYGKVRNKLFGADPPISLEKY